MHSITLPFLSSYQPPPIQCRRMVAHLRRAWRIGVRIPDMMFDDHHYDDEAVDEMRSVMKELNNFTATLRNRTESGTLRRGHPIDPWTGGRVPSPIDPKLGFRLDGKNYDQMPPFKPLKPVNLFAMEPRQTSQSPLRLEDQIELHLYDPKSQESLDAIENPNFVEDPNIKSRKLKRISIILHTIMPDLAII